MDLQSLLQEEDDDDFLETSDVNPTVLERSDGSSAFLSLTNVQLDCFLSENSGLLRDNSQPNLLCYFELADIVLLPPYSFQDLTRILSDPEVRLCVNAAKRLNANNTIKYVANYQSIQVRGKIPPIASHIKRKLGKKVSASDLETVLNQKIEACTTIDSILQGFHKISPQSILSGSHWLSNVFIGENYAVSANDPSHCSKEKSSLPNKTESKAAKQKDKSLPKNSPNVQNQGASKFVPKVRVKAKQIALKNDGSGVSQKKIVTSSSKNSKNQNEPKKIVTGNSQTAATTVSMKIKAQDGPEKKNTKTAIESTDVPGAYKLNNWELDCFLNERYGLLKHPLNPSYLCYFELRDLVIAPPCSFTDLIKFMKSPGISIHVKMATKVSGNKKIQFASHFQSISFTGTSVQDVENLLLKKSKVLVSPEKEKEYRSEKIAACKRAESIFSDSVKISLESVQSRSHWLHDGFVDEHFQMTSAPASLDSNSKVGNQKGQKSGEKINPERSVSSPTASQTQKSPKATSSKQAKPLLSSKSKTTTKPDSAKKPKQQIMSAEKMPSSVKLKLKSSEENMQQPSKKPQSSQKSLASPKFPVKGNVQHPSKQKSEQTVFPTNAPGVYALVNWKMHCLLNERYGLLKDPLNPDCFCYFELQDLVILPPYSMKDLMILMICQDIKIKVNFATKVGGNQKIQYVAHLKSIIFQGNTPPQISHLTRCFPVKFTKRERDQNLAGKIASCRMAENKFCDEQKILPNDILAGFHWLSEGVVDQDFVITSSENLPTSGGSKEIRSKPGLPIESNKQSQNPLPNPQQTAGLKSSEKRKLKNVNEKPSVNKHPKLAVPTNPSSKRGLTLSSSIVKKQKVEDNLQTNANTPTLKPKPGASSLNSSKRSQGARPTPVKKQKMSGDGGNEPKKSISSTAVPGMYDLIGWQLDCFLNERYGLLKDPINPARLCYFELRDLAVSTPFRFTDLIKLMNSPGISLKVTSATKVSGNTKTQFSAHFQSITFSGTADREVLHLRCRATGCDEETRKRFKAEKLEASKKADGGFAEARRISPQDIMSGKHWLSEAVVNHNHEVVSADDDSLKGSQDFLQKQKKQKLQKDLSKQSEGLVSSKQVSSDRAKSTAKKTPTNIKSSTNSVNRPKSTAKKTPSDIKNSTNSATKPKNPEKTLSKSSKILSNIVLDEKVHYLKGLKLDCFLNERYGLLKDPSEPSILCLFELSDIAVVPPYAFIDLVNLMAKPHVSVRVSVAKKVGIGSISFCAQLQSIFICGRRTDDLPQLRCNQSLPGNVIEVERRKTLLTKLQACQRLCQQIEDKGGLSSKILAADILNKTHWLSEGFVNSEFQITDSL